MSREVAFYHPLLRRLEPPEGDSEQPEVVWLRRLLGKWVRVVISDQRAFVGTLEGRQAGFLQYLARAEPTPHTALDGEQNLVIGGPVEVRPSRNGLPAETKSHRGSLMLCGRHILSVALYNQHQQDLDQDAAATSGAGQGVE
jgi:hypothetical protein